METQPSKRESHSEIATRPIVETEYRGKLCLHVEKQQSILYNRTSRVQSLAMKLQV